MIKAIQAMVHAVASRVDRKGRGVEWLGLDFLVDEFLGVHLLEANVSPDASHSTRVRVLAVYVLGVCMCLLFVLAACVLAVFMAFMSCNAGGSCMCARAYLCGAGVAANGARRHRRDHPAHAE